MQGNLFESKADILVNTVNLVGIMGKGVAKEFKNRFPDMFEDYSKACKEKKIGNGILHIFSEDDCIIVNLPTKQHWRNDSDYELIQKGLIGLRGFLMNFGPSVTVVVPALGCGCGNLEWSRVKVLIKYYLKDLCCTIKVFEPCKQNY